ncbi:MAG: class I SAM-dependent RNA methyltransferase [Rhodospirillales bacterium]|jgi:23S rRNA (uracil1939-C5)-methyltransferase
MPDRRRAKAAKTTVADAAPVEVTVASVGARGDGVADAGGRRLFVPLAAPGDRLLVRPGARRGDGCEAEIAAVLAPGPDRVEPPCPRFGDCGGCALQHLSDAARAAWARDRVVEALARVGLGGVPVAPTVTTPPGERRRAVLVAERRGRRVTLGFNARRSHRIVPPDGCSVLDPRILALLGPLAATLADVMADGTTIDVAVTLLDDGPDVVLVGRLPLDLAARERVAAFAEAADLARLSLRPGPTAPTEPLVHRRAGVLSMGGVPVSPPPGGFLQASPSGEAALRRLVADGTGAARRIADLFAGSGTFALPLAAAGAAVHAVEGDPAAVAALRGAATRVAGVTVERRDLDRDPVPARDLARFDAVVFDPPRAGADGQAREIAASGVPRVVGVSCNPASFARDARTLVDGGYALTAVTPVDQFVWSAHVELVGTFGRARG